MTQPATLKDLMDGVLDADRPFSEALTRAETRTQLDDARFLPSSLTEQEVHRRAVWAVTSQAGAARRRVRLHCAADGSTADQHDVGGRMVVDLDGVPLTRPVQMIGTVPGDVIAMDGRYPDGSPNGALYIVEVRHVLDVEVLS